jgi:putative ABC transport system permease protein
MLKNYWLIAVRKLWKHKAHAAINILGLTIGLTSCLIIYLLTRFELSADRFHPGGDRIYRVVASNGDSLRSEPMSGLGTALPVSIDAQIRGLETIAPFYTWTSEVTIPGMAQKKFDRPRFNVDPLFIITTPGYFATFSYQWLAGTPAASLREPFTVVLTEKEMHRYFGPIDPDQAIGRQVIYQDSLRTTVTGIVKDWDHNTDFGFRDFISLATISDSWLNADFGPEQFHNWTINAQALVRLEKGVKPATVEAQFPALLNKYPFPGGQVRLSLQPLADIHFNATWGDLYSHKAHLPTLYGLMGIAVFILLLAVVNFVNLATAQSLQRTKEIGIRKVLGGRRGDIAFQFLGETFLLTLLAVLLSMLITPLVMTLMNDWLPPGLHFNLSPANILFLLGITVVTSLLAGWYPAKVISALLPILSLKGQATRSLSPNRYLHRALIVFQFTISLVFIIGTVVVARQLHFALNSDLGFDKDAIITLRPTGRSTPGQLQVAALKIGTLPGVSLACRDMGAPAGSMSMMTGLEYHGPTDRKLDAIVENCDTAYIRLFGLRLLAGHNLSPGDSLRAILVNETLARAFGFLHPTDALGKVVENGDQNLTIAGVIKDFHQGSMHRVIQPLFFSTDDHFMRAVSVRLSAAQRR